MKSKLFILTFLILTGLTIAGQALALTTEAQRSAVKTLKPDFIPLQVGIPFPGCTSGENYLCDGNTIIGVKDATILVIALFQFSIILISIFLVVIIIVGGGQYLMSAGVAEKAAAGADKIKHGFYGLIVLIFSVVILTQINPALVNLQLTQLEKIQEVKLSTLCADALQHECGKPYGPAEQSCTGIQCTNALQYCPDSQKPVEVTDKNGGKSTVTKRVFGPDCVDRKADGAACSSNDECTSNSCFEGKCVVSKAGASCNSAQDCNGLICETNDANTCSFGKIGSDCSKDSECAPGYACQTNGFNYCIPKAVADYQRCSDSSQCKSGSKCLYFNWEAGSSKAIFGATLGSLGDIVVGAGNLAIKASTATSSSVCTPVDSEDKIAIYRCLTDSDCKTAPYTKCYMPSGICTSGDIGTPCVLNSTCKSQHCSANTFTGICSGGNLGDTCASGSPSECEPPLRCNPDTHYCVL